jgi:hypothetical protein
LLTGRLVHFRLKVKCAEQRVNPEEESGGEDGEDKEGNAGGGRCAVS